MNYRNIVIAGDVGSGTTTLAKNLADKLGWELVSAGDFFRKYSKENNIPLWDKASVPDEFERSIDNQIIDKLKNDKSIVFDTHYGGWFAKEMRDVLKILLICDRQIALKRMLGRKHTHDETGEEIEKRRTGLYEKFKKLYSTEDYEDPKYFDLVIDTNLNSEARTLEIAFKKFSST